MGGNLPKHFAACFKYAVKCCIVRKHKTVKSIQRLGTLEFLGFRCGENKRRRKDKRKEEHIMRKNRVKIIEKVVKARKKVKKPRAENDRNQFPSLSD